MITRGTSAVLVAADDAPGAASKALDETTIATARARDRTFLGRVPGKARRGRHGDSFHQFVRSRRLVSYDRVAATRSTTAGRGSSTSRFS